jgi:aminoglycoside/choline kinase family phosphotransferase
MLERESGYFLQALCRDYLQLDPDSDKLLAEFNRLADSAAKAPGHYLLHRDYQCRNLMVQQGRIRIIDYQGARLGPLAYDLASLLRDPYAALPLDIQNELVREYLTALGEFIDYDPAQFLSEYVVLSLQRNLQILGAFAFLTQKRSKPFFKQYIRPALCTLQELLAKPPGDEYPYLCQVTSDCLVRLDTVST